MAEKPFFITTPIYYINSVPHVGHAYTQIAADARARFERLRGKKVFFLTGTDENALKVARVAQEQGRDPLEFCDELAAAFKNVWDSLNISYDDFIRTTEERHRVPVQHVVQKLWDEGHLKLDSYSGWYSVPDETFFPEKEVVEREGKHYIAAPTEDQSKVPLEWVEEVGHFFKLSAFQDALLDYYDQNPEMLRPDTRKNETLSFIKMGLRDTSISRVQDWGIPIPAGVPGHEKHVVYVWFPDALLNYATAPGYLSDDPKKAAEFAEIWPPDLQLMSKDIFTRFHATLWPALLQALDLELPKELFAHGFWTVNGRKISKRDPETIVEPIAFSREIAELSGADFNVAVDALRYYCLREVTFGVDGDFSTDGCLGRFNSDLANGLGNTLQRTFVMLHKYFEGAVPVGQGQDFGLKTDLARIAAEIESDYASLNFSGALGSIWEVIARANRLIEVEKPWDKVKDGSPEVIADLILELLAVCQWAAVAISPAMPTAGALIWERLGHTAPMQWSDASNVDFAPGHHVAPLAPALFPRIKVTAPSATKAPAVKAPAVKAPKKEKPMNTETNLESIVTPTTEPGAAEIKVDSAPEPPVENPHITIDDFMKVQFKTGKVLEAERVPKADKLLRLQVDLGTEKRQILAGISQFYTPDEMIGRTVVVVANLAPRTLRGYESQGMLLAASDDEGNLALVSPISDVAVGSTVR
jgi:methionyl-tRNA synthetase